MNNMYIPISDEGSLHANLNAPEELVLGWNAEKWSIHKPLLQLAH